MRLLRAEVGRVCRHLPAGGLGVDAGRGYGDQLVLRVAKRRQTAAEHAAGVQADGPVQPLGGRDRRMAVNHLCPAAIVGGPLVAHRQAELVGLAGGLAIQGELAHRPRGAPLHLLLHARVRDHQAPAVQLVVAGQGVDELRHPVAPLRGLGGKLLQRLFQPPVQLHVAAAQLAPQLVVVVSWQTERGSGSDRVHHQPQAGGACRSAVHQVAQKDQPPAVGMGHPPAAFRRLLPTLHGIAQLAQQRAELVEAAVQIADDVERPAVRAAVGLQRLAFDDGRVDLRGRPEAVLAEPLAAQPAQRMAQQLALVADHAPADRAVAARQVALLADRFRDVEGQRHRHRVVLAGDRDELPAVLGADVGGVHDREAAGGQPLAGDEVEHVEGIGGGFLGRLVVAHQGAAGVGGQDLGGREVRTGERRFARPAGAHQYHQAELGDGYLHRRKIPICVGAPCSGSVPPIGSNVTR